jgi:hypothetical protein
MALKLLYIYFFLTQNYIYFVKEYKTKFNAIYKFKNHRYIKLLKSIKKSLRDLILSRLTLMLSDILILNQ